MAAIGRIAIAAITMAIGGAVIAATGKAATQSQQQEQHRKRQGDQAHSTPPLIPLGSKEPHHGSMAAAGLDQGIFMQNF